VIEREVAGALRLIGRLGPRRAKDAAEADRGRILVALAESLDAPLAAIDDKMRISPGARCAFSGPPG